MAVSSRHELSAASVAANVAKLVCGCTHLTHTISKRRYHACAHPHTPVIYSKVPKNPHNPHYAHQHGAIAHCTCTLSPQPPLPPTGRPMRPSCSHCPPTNAFHCSRAGCAFAPQECCATTKSKQLGGDECSEAILVLFWLQHEPGRQLCIQLLDHEDSSYRRTCRVRTMI